MVLIIYTILTISITLIGSITLIIKLKRIRLNYIYYNDIEYYTDEKYINDEIEVKTEKNINNNIYISDFDKALKH